MNNESFDRVVASRGFDRDGWFRHLPPISIEIVSALVRHACLTRADLVALLVQESSELIDLPFDVWEKPYQWTGADIAEVDAEEGIVRGAEELAALARAEIRDDAERLVGKKQQFEKNQLDLGLAPAHSIEALLDFMIACGLVVTDSSDQLSLSGSARLPAEMLNLTPEQVEEEDRMRWVDIYQAQVGRIQNYLLQQPVGSKASIDELSIKLDLEEETTRQAVAAMIVIGGHSVSADPEVVPRGEQFTIH